MKRLYRQYRQVKISRRGSQKPEVQGYEEIWRDGERQVRHWTDWEQLDWLSGETPDLFDFWLTPESELGENNCRKSNSFSNWAGTKRTGYANAYHQPSRQLGEN